ncbi:MAG: hypothetical protein V7749_00820 [Cocleimonas sp.]
MSESIAITAMLSIPAYLILCVFVRPILSFFSYRGYSKQQNGY